LENTWRVSAKSYARRRLADWARKSAARATSSSCRKRKILINTRLGLTGCSWKKLTAIVYAPSHVRAKWSIAFIRIVHADIVLIQNLHLDLSDFIDAEIAVVDAIGALVRCNRKWDETARIGELLPKLPGWNYGAECEAAIERGCSEASRILGGLRAVLKSGRPNFVDTYACPFNGRYHWYQVQISAFDLNNKRHAILMHVDVSALQRDSLTGMANRAMFDAQLELTLSLARDRRQRTGVIFVDMNRLKVINDLHGHRVGDEALITLAAELRKICGPDAVVARIGGDEFGVVLSANCDGLTAPRLRARLKSGLVCSSGAAGKPVFVSASVGVALYPDDGTTSSELLASADKSMYTQKRALSVA
jgi:diguanylate cyclase (GGDEF)-like protein